MLGILFAQSFGSTVNVFATTNETADQSTETVQAKQTVSTEAVDNQATIKPTTESSESSQQLNDNLPVPITENNADTHESPIVNTPTRSVADTSSTKKIEDEILANMVITNMEGVEYSQTSLNRVLNNSPVMAKLSFVIEDKDYVPGSVYTATLPNYLGYSDVSGEVGNVGANWAVDAQSKTLTITFNQRVKDTSFTLDLKSYLSTDANPLVTIETPGVTKNHYDFDLYEEIDAIKYEETERNFGLKGNVYYNLDRTLAGKQKLELAMSETPGAVFTNASKDALSVSSYDVDVNGNIIASTQRVLEQGKEYTVDEDTLYQASVTITAMEQQKAYSLSVTRELSLTSTTDYYYSFYNQYPTTKLGGISLKRPSGATSDYQFTAKTSATEKVVKQGSLGTLQGASFQDKGRYYIYIYDIPTQTKTGEQIILESKNGQEIGEYHFSGRTVNYQEAKISDYFDIRKEANRLILTATKDSNLRIQADKLVIPFEQKNIDVTISTPAVSAGKEIMMISDLFVQPISIINPTNAETAWGNYDSNGAYMSDTTVGIEGSSQTPIANVEINVEHPSYLQLRAPKEIFPYYKLNTDYTVTKTANGSVVKFLKPVTHSIHFDLGFNYVPDSLPQNKSIPSDKIPVTLSADGIDKIETSVTTNRKLYSERTLQASENQFLINARNDTFNSLVVTTKIPTGADVVFDIYDVSNDQVESIYPQYWDRGQYFDKPLAPTSAGYPNITFDAANNMYTFDFGKTSKRYIIEYKYANGWIDANTVYVTGSTAEPLSGNQVQSALAAVKNKAVDFLATSQTAHETLKNVTKNTLTTKNINNQTRKVKNPIFDITTKGTTNAAIDLNSIAIEGIPKDSYTVKQTKNGAQIIFADYTLTDNITISYNTISQNAGQISTETLVTADNLDQMTAARRTVTSTPVTLKFSAGDAEGVVYLAQAEFHTYKESEQTVSVPAVQFELVDPVMNTHTEFTTDDAGNYTIDSIMSGDYRLVATQIPAGYTIDEEYLTGKTIKLKKDANKIEIPLIEKNDQTSISAKDSTIYVGTNWKAQDNFVSATDADGNPVEFDQVTVAGTVDTSQVGEYEVTYQNQGKEAKALIKVVANQKTLAVKDSTIYVGDTWQEADNFVSATDASGKEVALQEVTTSGTVDTNTAGVYSVTYSYLDLNETATITVLADQTSVSGKNSTIYVGTNWDPADNFTGATDKTGKPLGFSQIKVTGTVDTNTIGTYEITYHNAQKEAKVTVEVVDQQETLAVKDSSIYVGDNWEKADNFVSATNGAGQTVSLEDVQTKGTVDTKTPGVYNVVYTYGSLSETAKITVKPDLSTLVVKDSTLYVGDEWTSKDNFVSATDRDGKPIQFEEVKISGDVDTKTKGEYKVAYSVKTTGESKPQTMKRVVTPTPAVNKTERTETAIITVNDKKTVTPNQPNNPTQRQSSATKISKSGVYPKTGETTNQLFVLLGLVLVLLTILGINRVRKRRTD